MNQLIIKVAKKSKYLLLAAGIFLILESPARADFEKAISEMNTFSEAIITMIGGFTTVAITPVGMSAAIKCFRHIVLANV